MIILRDGTDMATYSESEKRRILNYPIETLLAHFGRRTDHRGEMYYSPFREEDTPSFHISRCRNLWMDFGSGEGGNVLSLVGRLAGIRQSEAWDYIAALDPLVVPSYEQPARNASQQKRQMITIDRISEHFTLSRLISYSSSRGIPHYILEKYCRQVAYHIDGVQNMKWFAIGFPTNEGWMLRLTSGGAYGKMCTSASCSFIGPSGQAVSSAASDTVEVFEGFFDFLSWLVLRDRTLPFCDVCVLNSVTNLPSAMDFICSHRRISCWLDDDRAGRNALHAVRAVRKDAADHLDELRQADSNDVNELLMSTLSQNQSEHQTTCSNISTKLKL